MTIMESIMFFSIVILAISMCLITLQNMGYKRKKLNNELDPNKSFLENFFSA